MAFRSLLITSYIGQLWPAWFVEKYRDKFNIAKGGPLSTKCEVRLQYEILTDILAALTDSDLPLRAVALHECGGITLIDFTKSREIVFSEPRGIDIPRVENITHGGCCYCDRPAPDRTPREKTDRALVLAAECLLEDPSFSRDLFRKIASEVMDSGGSTTSAKIAAASIILHLFGISRSHYDNGNL